MTEKLVAQAVVHVASSYRTLVVVNVPLSAPTMAELTEAVFKAVNLAIETVGSQLREKREFSFQVSCTAQQVEENPWSIRRE